MELIQTGCALSGLVCLMLALYSVKSTLKASLRPCCNYTQM